MVGTVDAVNISFVKRGIFGVLRRGSDAGRFVRRGDPTRATGDGTIARAGGAGTLGADAAAGIAAVGTLLADGGADLAGESGPRALEPRADWGRSGAGPAGA